LRERQQHDRAAMQAYLERQRQSMEHASQQALLERQRQAAGHVARIGDASVSLCQRHAGLFRIERAGGSATLSLDELQQLLASVRDELHATDYAFMLRGRPRVLRLPGDRGIVVYSVELTGGVDLLLILQHQPACDYAAPPDAGPALRISLDAAVDICKFLNGASFALTQWNAEQ